MNLNPLATAGLVMIGIAQMAQAYITTQPTPQETHFRVIQLYCKKEAQNLGGGEAAYIGCMSRFTQSRTSTI